MAREGKWQTFAQHECLYLVGPIYGRDYIVPAMGLKTCPRCGQPCDLNNRDTWAKVVRRKISEAVWYRPATWGKFHWEYKMKGHLEDGWANYRMSMRNARVGEEKPGG